MWRILLSLIALIAVASASSKCLLRPRIDGVDNGIHEDYRLTNTTVPSRYRITLTVPQAALSGGDTSFTGSVIITFQVTEPTNVVRFHSLVNITNLSIARTGAAVTPLTITNYTLNATTETVVVLLETSLTANIDYNLGIQYSGILDPSSMNGFYRSEYVADGVRDYLGATQFETTNARRAFPCFDEPQYKATFLLTLVFPVGFDAASNTPATSTVITTTTTTKVFTETPRMSTYLLAFTVSKFTCTTAVSNNVQYGVCSRPDFANDRVMAFDSGMEILEAFNTWTNYSYNSTSIGKMDQYAIPDFSAGAMENWGLVTYREYYILFNETFTSNFYKQKILNIIAHEFAHMWFGNLVTTKWWDTTFLNEGFARYFQYFLPHQLPGYAEYEMNKQFIIEQQQSVFIEDAHLTSEALTSGAWTPAQISNKFGSISYNKGASTLRMIENLIGTNSFQTALRQYIIDNAFAPSTPDRLWTSFETVFAGSGTLPATITFSQFIDNWANKAGFPVVTATANGNQIVLSQKRFLYNGTDDTQWYVPITYLLPGSRTFASTWLQPNASMTLNNIIVNNSWIIINHDSRGYYRVHYDTILRERLISALRNDHNQISDLNRAQIIDDALNLARAGHIKYSEAFKVLDYLKNETSYYPWYASITGLNYLSVRLGNSSLLGQRINGMLLDLVDKVSANVSTTNWATTDQITTLKLQAVWATACRSGQKSCILEARRLFREFRINGTSINPNIRDVVYCNALRYSTDIAADYTFLWNRLQTINQPHEYIYILVGLGCSTSREHLTNYLNESLNPMSVIRLQDFAAVWSSVYASSSVGLEVAFDYFVKNHAKILEYYPKAVSILPNIVARLTTDAEVKKLQQFINQQPQNATLRAVAESALNKARENLQWQLRIQPDLNQHFGIHTSSATTFGISVYLLLLTVFFM